MYKHLFAGRAVHYQGVDGESFEVTLGSQEIKLKVITDIAFESACAYRAVFAAILIAEHITSA
jgi:hypothetical protein